MSVDSRSARVIRVALLVLAAAAASLLPFFLTSLLDGSDSPRAPLARNGVMDLRSWDLRTDGVVPLSGEWTFFPGELLDDAAAVGRTDGVPRRIPDQWKGSDAGGIGGLGAGTYRLTIRLPPGAERAALRWTTVSTSFEASVSGTIVAAAGHPSRDPAAAVAAYRPGVAEIPDRLLRTGEAAVVVRVSNHEYRTGGMWRPFIFGDAESLRSSKRTADLSTLLFLGILIGISIQHLVVFIFRKAALSSWFFFLFALSIAFRSLVTGEYAITGFFTGISFDLLIRLEYVSAYLPIPLAAHFFFVEFRHRPPYPVLIVLTPFLPLIPFLPLPWLTRSLLVYYPFAFASIAYVAVMMVREAFREKQSGMMPIIIGGVCCMSAAVNDMLFASFKAPIGNMLPPALVAFAVLMTFSLSRRYVDAFAQIEHLLSEKNLYLKEMHHRVKNSLQIVASVMTLQANRVVEPETKALFATMRERVRSVALVHEKLHSSLSGNDVDLGDYVRDLVRQVASSYSPHDGTESPMVEVGEGIGSAPIEYCVDLGLSLTELLINAYKHAARPTEVSLKRLEDSFLIAVRDAGTGFPAAFDPYACSSLGFKIVVSVIRRRGGEVRIRSGGLVELLIPFPIIKKNTK